MIFSLVKNTDMTYAEFSAILKFCKESPDFDHVMEFWKKQVLFNYADKGEEPDPSLWFTTYTDAIDLAQGGSEIVGLFRHLGIGTGYIYEPKDEIISKHPEHYEKYFQKVKLPNGNIGAFQEDGFDRAVGNVITAWNALYSGLSSSTMVVADVIKNWDLDTGVDMDSPGKEVTYWA